MAETGKLQVKLGWNLTKFDQGLFQVKTKIGKLSNSIKADLGSLAKSGAMIGGGAFALKVLTDKVAEQAASFESLQDATGTTTQGMAALKNQIYQVNQALGLKDAKAAAEQLQLTREASGLLGADLEALTIQTGQLAARFKSVEAPDALKAQVELMRRFGTSVKEVGDAYAYLAGKGGDLRGELADTVLEYSVQFKEAGLSFAQTIGVIGRGLKDSWSIDFVGDMFKEGRLRLTAGDAPTILALQQIGLADLPDQIKAGGIDAAKAFSQVAAKLATLPQAQAFGFGKDIFGSKFEDLGTETALSVLDGMKDRPKIAGAIDQVAHQLGGRFSWKWGQALSAVDNVWSKALDVMAPALLPLIKLVERFAAKAEQFGHTYPNLTKVIALSGAAFSVAAIGVGALSAALTVLTGPVGLVLGGVALVGFGLYQLEQKTGALSAAWSGFSEAIKPGLLGLKEAFGALWVAIKPGLSWALENLKKLTGETDGWAAAFKVAGKVVAVTMDVMILKPIKGVAEAITQVIDAWGEMSDAMGKGFSLEGIKAFASGALKMLLGIFKAAFSVIPGGAALTEAFEQNIPKALAAITSSPQGQNPTQAQAPIGPWRDSYKTPDQGALAGSIGPRGTQIQIGAIYSGSRDAAEDIRRFALAGG